jgi:hypothetical protein
MPYRATYPATVAEVLDDSAKFNPAALAVVRGMARAKPWRLKPRQRLELFRQSASELAVIYGIACPRVGPGPIDCYLGRTNQICLTAPYSVVTFLHEFGHARGFDERQTCRWSINLFRRCFPRSFAACRQVRHMLVKA